jgi:hypothetical protein
VTNPKAGAPWPQTGSVSSMVDVLSIDHGFDPEDNVHDVSVLDGAAVPAWIQTLPLPPGWQPLALPENANPKVARCAVADAHDGRWEASETLSVFSYTGYAHFTDVISNAACTLQDLHPEQITTRVLSVPPIRYAVAVRATGIVTLGGQRMWLHQSNYLAGSKTPHAGRLIIHTMIVDAAAQPRWAPDVEYLAAAVHHGFSSTLHPPVDPPDTDDPG